MCFNLFLQFNRFVASYPPQNQAEVNAYNRVVLTIIQNADFASTGDDLFYWLDTNLPLAAKILSQRSSLAPLPVSPATYWDSLSSNE